MFYDTLPVTVDFYGEDEMAINPFSAENVYLTSEDNPHTERTKTICNNLNNILEIHQTK